MQVVEKEGRKVLTLGSEFDETVRSTFQNSQAASSAAAELEQRAHNLREVASVLRGLPNGWRQRDPGKYGVAYWFVGEGARHVVVRDLLPDDVAIFEGDSKKWSRHLSELGYIKSLDAVPPHTSVVSLDEVAKAACPECGTEQPLIESYCQTFDSPDGDEWQKQRLVLCCGKVQVISTETRGMRF